MNSRQQVKHAKRVGDGGGGGEPLTTVGSLAQGRPVSRCDLSVRRLAGKLRLSSLFKSCGLWTLARDLINPSQLMER